MIKTVMMKLLLLPIVFLSLLVIPTASAETPYVFIQIIPKDLNGNMLGLFQLDKITRLNYSALDSLLDSEFSPNNDSIYQLDDKKIQVIIRENTDNYTSSQMVSHTSLMANTENGTEEAIRFAHDGYMVSPGDSVTTIWYFVRTI
jgi:hypothetical protein